MSTKGKQRAVLKAALRYAREFGWSVFPIKPNSKEPAIKRGFLAASTDPDQIKSWWAKWPDANIGIACGGEHGPIVIDYDEPKERELSGSDCPAVSKMPLTLKAQSQPARLHRFYLAPRSGDPIPRMVRPFKDDDGRKYAVDILGDGGYVIVAPSIHPDTDKPYKWLNEEPLKPFPRSLEKALRQAGKSGDAKKHRIADPLPDVIQEGERDTVLTSIAGTMRRRGVSPEAILEALRVENTQRVRPMLSDKQLRKIAYSIGKKAPLPLVLSEEITDLSLAERFAQWRQDKLKFCDEWQRWLVWNGHYWETDTKSGHRVDRLVERMVRNYVKQLMEHPDREAVSTRLKEIRKYLSHRKLTDVQQRARAQKTFAVRVADLNTNPYLFNVGNGTVNLMNGQLQEANPADLLTKTAKTRLKAKAKCPRWMQFLEEITGGDQAFITYLQRIVGYTMLGTTEEHCFFFCYGPGGNGKSTFLEVIGFLFGNYATTINFETLLQSRYGSDSRGDLADLYGARFVSANETPESNGRWNAARIKQLTGGDRLRARRLWAEPFEFDPTHTLWCRGNTRPASHDQSTAFWQRMKLIPFTKQFRGTEAEEIYLKEQLIGELPGILNWAIKGCVGWHKHRMPEPECVRKASKEYQDAEDVFGEFVTARCVLGHNEAVGSADLYRAFTSWWEETRGPKSRPMSQRDFVSSLEAQKGIRKKRDNQGMRWRGIALRDDDEE